MKRPKAQAQRPLEKDELNALERAHREAAASATELHQAKAEAQELQERLNQAKARAATARASLSAATSTITELTQRLTA